jgi:RNA polymerase sigma-70 factor (ECF subfamily)
MATSPDVTQLLLKWGEGDDGARDQLMPLLYGELRRLAQSYLRRDRPGHILQPTALVNEAYLRLADQSKLECRDRTHFFGIASHVMRQILVDHFRSSNAAKRGAGSANLPLDEMQVAAPARESDILALDDALMELAKLDERKSRLIELKFFGGLTIEESADLLGISTATVGRELRLAIAWAHRYMSGEPK